jgi:uncharacterized protein
MLQTSDPTRNVPTRRISFDVTLEDLPRTSLGAATSSERTCIATLSAVFPDGEDFFVRSVRHYRDRITDPALKRQVAGFIGQEAVHGREHRASTSASPSSAIPPSASRRCTRWGLGIRERSCPPVANLARPPPSSTSPPPSPRCCSRCEPAPESATRRASMFVWHALEESEHKAVAFDVYRAVGGSERTRVITMKMIPSGSSSGMTCR